MEQISYREGYKYQLCDDYSISIPVFPDADISGRFVKLTTRGLLTIRTDYAWDGPSGPTVDTPSVMRAALVHDALYQLMRERQLDAARWRWTADRIFLNIMLEDKVLPVRAELWYRGVSMFGEPNADPVNEKPVMTAPEKRT